MQVPDDNISPQDKARAAEQRQKQATLSDVLEKAGDAYRKQLKASPKAISYLKGRGLSGEIARQFGYAGYSLREVTVGGGDLSTPVPMLRMARASAAGMADESQPVAPGQATVTVTVNGSIQLSPR